MLKRILSAVLTAALVVSALPLTPFADDAPAVLYGDANDDGKINLNDILTVRRHIAEEDTESFSFTNADVNVDGKVDLTDLLMMRKYMAEWDIVLGPELLTVNFYDGDRLIDTMSTPKGSALGKTPSVEKTSKADGIFVGWYTDKEFTTPFYSETVIAESMSVYAKYDPYDGAGETLTVDSFSKTDVATSYTVTVKGTGDVNAALTLVSKDGTEPPALKITDKGEGVYEIGAEGGFRAGSSYELSLAKGFNFVGEDGELPETVRTAFFTVKKDIVDNMKLNEDIVYIADTAGIKYQNVDGDEDGDFDDTVESLGSKTGISTDGSTATVPGAESMDLADGDIVCFYVGTAPKDRVYTGPDAKTYIGEPEVYVRVKSTGKDTLVFTPLAQDEISEVFDIPDVLPLKGNATGNSINISSLDLDVYSKFGLETPTLEYAKDRIGVGDFVAVYGDTPDAAVFGKITGYNKSSGKIDFEVCSAEDIVGSRGIYVQPSISGDEIVSEEAKQEIEQTMFAQIAASGFAEEAAHTLAVLSTKTDGFKNMDNIRYVLLGEDGITPLTDAEIRSLNLGASFELTEGVTLSVELITDGDELHFRDGVQLAVGIEAKFEVEAEEGKVVIELNATFIEELEIKPTVDGDLTYTEILGIPVPNGVRVSASIDVKNYTAYDFDVMAYTVAPEDESTWDKLTNIMKNPTEITTMLSDSGLIPEKFKGQLETVADIFEKIEEVEKNISDAKAKYKEDKETLEGYAEDLESLWAVVEDMRAKDTKGELFTKETWAAAAMELSKTNIAQELLHLTDDGITDGDAGVDNDVSIKSVEELMERYSEMLEKETDWVTLLDKNLVTAEGGVYAVNFMLKVDFVIRTNMSIALGSTLEYETGKRYCFWFKVGLYSPTGGSSSMDLIDESLAFQFYVMGKLEVKMGAKITLGVSIGSASFAYAGIYAEVGPYVKLYGFFVYSYQRMREANTLTNVKKEQMMGALYMETGIYLVIGVEASAIMGLFEVSCDFVDAEFPILEAGSNEFPYEFSYELVDDEKIIIRDSDGNSGNGVTMILPENLRAVRTMILTKGTTVNKIFDFKDYNVYLSNPNFSLDPATGEIKVSVPDGVRSMDCEMRLTFKHGKMAFSDYDIAISIPLFWTNLSTEELSEYYTASVRVGNAIDGYQTVWSKRILKNTQFDLPTADEIKDIIGYNNLKYASGAYAENYDTSAGIIEDKVYDFNVTSKTYSITVNGIEDKNASQVFTAKYGETFDFSSLAGTGKNNPSRGEYTVFHNVTTDAAIVVGKDADGRDVYETIDLGSPISERVALALEEGITATANYVDNSVKVVFVFGGTAHDEITEVICKGDTVDLTDIELMAAEDGLAITDIRPELGPVRSSTVYTVTLGVLTGDSFTVSFEENGGSAVSDITKIGGSIMGALPVPARPGYKFGGWFTDNGTFKNEFKLKLFPKENVTLYAKWTAEEYNVTFHVNGGTGETPAGIKAVYDSTYGTLPTAERTGHGFAGWYTAPEGGTKITDTSKVTVTADQTLYAHWNVLKEIPKSVFSFTKPANPTYDKNTEIDNSANVTFTPEAYAGYSLSDFVIEYKLDSDSSGYVSKPKDAGTYIARVSRPADNTYAKFEATYTDVLTINKAQGEILDAEAIASKLTSEKFYSNLSVTNSFTEGVDYIGDGDSFRYGISNSNELETAQKQNYVHWFDGDLLCNIYDDKNIDTTKPLYIWIELAEGKNYLADPDVVINPTAVEVDVPKSMWSMDGLSYKVTIKTSDVKNAGTDAMIWTALDECPSEMDRWNSIDGKNFERNNTDSMTVHAGTEYLHRSSLDTVKMWIKFEPKHTAAGWHCEWIKLDVYYNGELLIEGDEVSVDRWFEDAETASFTLTADGGYVQTNVKLIGYDALATDVTVNDTSAPFAWSWDGSMSSSLTGGKTVNAYDYVNAPVLSTSFSNGAYDKFITRTVNGFTVDSAGLAAAMKKDKVTSITLKTAIEFEGIGGKNSVSPDCQNFTRNVKFTVG